MPSLYQRSKLKSTNVKQPTPNKHVGAITDYASRRYVKEGYPIEKSFNSIDQIKEYLSKPKLTCLLCGNEFKWLSGTHFKKIHNITEREYKDRYNLPYSIGLICEELKIKRTQVVMKHYKTSLDGSPPQIQKNYKVNKGVSAYKRLTSSANATKTPTHNKKWPHEKGYKCTCEECRLRRNDNHNKAYRLRHAHTTKL
jgi:transposase-like protein